MAEILDPRAILDRLVAFRTVSSESNLDLIDFVETYLADHGIASTRVPDETGTKAGLFTQVGPNVDGGIALSGHTDVVPVVGQDWVTNPWEVIEKDGLIYGRGTCDMKGFVALAIAAMVKAKARDLKRPLQLALSRDEEIGLLGAPGLAQAMLDTLPKARGVIVGEPTEMKVVSGHKGCEAIYVVLRGFEVHSSLVHTGVSAVMCAARLVEWARLELQANMAKEPSAVAALYDPPFTTLHVGRIAGGTATNITAKDCKFSIDIRCVGDESPEDYYKRFQEFAHKVESEMQAIHPECYIKMELEPGPGVVPEDDGPAEALARKITGDNGSHTVSYGTDGGHFQNLGYSVVICGPGNIEQAHQPNEFLDLAQFAAGEEFLDAVINDLEET